jgi:gliding motility-associated-like protein
VTVTDANGCTKNATVNIDGYPLPTVNAGPDQVYCYGIDSIVLSASGAATYLWSPADVLSCSTCAITGANPNTTTNFQVIGFDEHNCRDTDWVNVTVFTDEPATVGEDIVICKGDKAQLLASGGTNYVWTPSPDDYESPSSSPSTSPESTTTYTVVITKNECFTDTMTQKVTVFERPTIDLGPDQKVLPGTLISLHADTTHAESITWEPVTDLSCDDCIDPTATIFNTITYTATVYNNACKAQDDITITVSCDGNNIFFANTFTPNNDGNNDVFFPQTPGMDMIKLFRVYNRWGQLLHEVYNFPSSDPKYGWDGSFNGNPLSPDVYVYYLETSCPDGQKVFKKGDISLLK